MLSERIESSDQMLQRSSTKHALFVTHLLAEPFVALFALISILLAKELHATPLQIAILTMLRPTVALLSFYWSAISHYHGNLKTSVMWATALSVTPFIFTPITTNVWYFIFAAGCYSLFARASVPAMMEILKQNVGEERQKLYSQVSTLSYLVGIICALSFGSLLDKNPALWTTLFSGAALLHLLPLRAQSNIIVASYQEGPPKYSSLLPHLTNPWKESYRLMQENRGFRIFQMGFFVAGFGLMFATPAIPFYLNSLSISFTELFVAFTVLKGFGFITTTHIWSKRLNVETLSQVSIAVFAGFALYLFTLLCYPLAPLNVLLAYLVYGVAQAGSHLVWNLSGTLFSEKKSSAPYTAVNVLLVGVRGMIAPPLGGLFANLFGPTSAIIVGLLFCFSGALLVQKAVKGNQQKE